MRIPKEQALKMITEKIDQFQDVLKKATYDNRYDETYSLAYHGTETLIKELFSKGEVMNFRSNVTQPVFLVGGRTNPQAELQDYKKHIGKCITQLRVYHERVSNFWQEEKAEKTTGAKIADQTTTEILSQGKKNPTDPKKILVIYGRNEKARASFFTFLRAIGLHPLEWIEMITSTGKGSPYIGEVLDRGFSEAKAVLVLLTPDDVGRVKEEFRMKGDPPSETELSPQARLNVIFEAGMAFGFCAERTILVELGSLRPFSDIAGRHVVRLDNSVKTRQELAQRLLALRCAVDISGSDWHTAGDFKIDSNSEKGFQGLLV
jgi:predicted nucleotide-binding protein